MEGNHNLFVQAKANEYKQAIELYEVCLITRYSYCKYFSLKLVTYR